jgi:hypothetical protein
LAASWSANGSRWPRAAAGRAVDDAEQRPDRQLDAVRQPAVEVLEPPVVHPDLATAITLAVSDEHRPAGRVNIGLDQRQCLGDPQAAAPEHRDHPADAQTVAILAGLAHDRDDLLDPGRVSRVAHPLVMRGAPRQIAGQRDLRPPPADRVDQDRVWHDLLLSGAILVRGLPNAFGGSSRLSAIQSTWRVRLRRLLPLRSRLMPDPVRLPRARDATIPTAKLVGYVLSTTHERRPAQSAGLRLGTWDHR